MEKQAENIEGGDAIVAFRDVSKVYPNGTVALRDVSFSIRAGSIHAICGENGAGKSTLMKILFGIENATAGEIVIDGQTISSWSPEDASARGIGMVHQHFSLVPTLTVTENIILGHEPVKGGFIDRVSARKSVEELMQHYDLHADPDAITGTLSVAAQQKIEILKALARRTRLLILDEPTAVLSPPEIEELMRRLKALRDEGITILFISHKLNEVRELAESVTVLRAGAVAGTEKLADVPDDAIMQMVMGHAVEIPERAHKLNATQTVLEMKGVTIEALDPADRIRDVNLTIGEGEIVGVAGVDGSGQRGLVSALSGLMRASQGAITLNGADMGTADTASWRKKGLAYLPADRFSQGGAPGLSLAENTIAGTDGNRDTDFGPFLRWSAIKARVSGMIKQYSVRAGAITERLDSLSGGNAQKLIAARELATKPKFLIADQPTRGIDVSAAAFLHRRIDEVAQGGCAVLLVSADLDELLRLSDRIVVFFNGRIVAVLRNGPDITPAVLGPYMLGTRDAA
ncbi:ABC transporter ATP-binding protein [Brucella pseudogrignonensis]|uniref:ABC transporter ATP-binding protein n=1 Tax=Brucella pseudogrignonensis TaxID=419475 RepID=UPI00190BF28A|nr:ABC transporter ATP-binding protein [Brucella pseudogrignonensis]MBK0022446.1 ABC transporter ATP-binding protein [Ochrobactrum sp. S45]MBK0044461.1 ABC transporter ATP-binding protein [Ochrobactrum sp. S46]UKK94430.1 ABC transporter ATP-binding protein [Brucella pseudogrignonensis]